MANTLYAEGNYFVIIYDGETIENAFPKNEWGYLETATAFYIYDLSRKESPVEILIASVGDWEDESATDYTESTLRDFLQSNIGDSPDETAYQYLQAASFNSSSSYISLASTLTATSFTISFLFNTPDVSSNQRIAGGSTTNFIEVRNTSNTIVVRFNSGGTSFTIPALSNDTWYRGLIACNAGTVRVFINDTESSSGAQAVAGAPEFTKIGTTDAFTSFYEGLIDDFLIWEDYGDPAAEATALYNGGEPIDPLEVFPLAEQLYRLNGNVNNSGSDGGSGTPTDITYVAHT